jgi:hypothetical protein
MFPLEGVRRHPNPPGSLRGFWIHHLEFSFLLLLEMTRHLEVSLGAIHQNFRVRFADFSSGRFKNSLLLNPEREHRHNVLRNFDCAGSFVEKSPNPRVCFMDFG